LRDDLGKRMKDQYEVRTRWLLPRRTFTIVRIDGKAFHTYTRGCDRPFDAGIVIAMNAAAMRVVEEAQGAKLAYVQSDEISVVLTDFDRIETCAWFDGNVQKIVSVSASLATVGFNVERRTKPTAAFDARAFTIPDPTEVENYFIWRQKDAMRNSVSMLAQANFSAKQLHGKDVGEMLAMLEVVGVRWADQPLIHQRGWCLVRRPGEPWAHDAQIPVFTEDREYLRRAWRVEVGAG